MPTLPLTAQTVKGLQPGPTGRTDYFDAGITGFGLRVSSGVKSWIYVYRAGGRPRRYTIGRYPDLSLAEARDKARTARNQVAQGVDPSEVKIGTRHAETFGDLTAQYIREYAKPRKRTWREDQRVIDVELHRWRHVKARDIKRRDVISLLKGIADRPAPIQANRVQALIRKVFNWAIGRDLIETNPCAGVVPFGKERRRTRVLSDDEIAQFWRAADLSWRTSTDCPVGAILQLQLLTAQRGQEVRFMRWSDMNLQNGWWIVPAEFAKNGVATRVFLNRPTVRLLREMEAISAERQQQLNRGRERKGWETKPASVWVFPRRRAGKAHVEGEDLPVRWTQKQFGRILLASGAQPFKPHDLRRTAATKIPIDGPQEARRFLIKRILNHADGEVTAVYDLYSYDTEKKRAMEAWGRLVERLVRRSSLRRAS